MLVGVLKGAAIFLSDLARQIQLDTTFDFISVSSYGSGKQSSGEVRLYKDVDQSMSDKNIILVEDILDTWTDRYNSSAAFFSIAPRAA